MIETWCKSPDLTARDTETYGCSDGVLYLATMKSLAGITSQPNCYHSSTVTCRQSAHISNSALALQLQVSAAVPGIAVTALVVVVVPRISTVDAMPGQTLQLSGRGIGSNKRHTLLQSSSCTLISPHKAFPTLLQHSRKLLAHKASSLRQSNLLVTAVSYTSLSPTNGAARPASSAEPPAPQQSRPPPPAIDHSKATIKVQLKILMVCSDLQCSEQDFVDLLIHCR